MPKVGDKEFSYTPEGMEAAKQEATLTGEPLEQTPEYDTYDATQRNQVVEGYQEGGGTPEPTQYAKGGEVPQYAWGGKILGGMKKRIKQAMTRPSQWREWKPFEQRGLGLGKVLAGGAQALTNTDDPMYGKLSDSNIQSLGDMFGALNKSRHDIVDPTDPNTTGFGYREGGDVPSEMPEGYIPPKKEEEKKADQDTKPKETSKKHGRTKVVKKDVSINVGNEKVSLGKISSLETDFVDTPADDLIKGAKKAIEEGVKAFKPGVKKAKEKAKERGKAYRKGLKETGEKAKKVIGKAKESISKVKGAIKTQAEKQKAKKAREEAKSEAELKAYLLAREEKSKAKKEKKAKRKEERKAKRKETWEKIKGSLKRKDKKLKYRDDDTGGKYK